MREILVSSTGKSFWNWNFFEFYLSMPLNNGIDINKFDIFEEINLFKCTFEVAWQKIKYLFLWIVGIENKWEFMTLFNNIKSHCQIFK